MNIATVLEARYVLRSFEEGKLVAGVQRPRVRGFGIVEQQEVVGCMSALQRLVYSLLECDEFRSIISHEVLGGHVLDLSSVTKTVIDPADAEREQEAHGLVAYARGGPLRKLDSGREAGCYGDVLACQSSWMSVQAS